MGIALKYFWSYVETLFQDGLSAVPATLMPLAQQLLVISPQHSVM